MFKKSVPRAKETSRSRNFSRAERFLYDVAAMDSLGDIKEKLDEYRDPAKALKSYDHAPRVSRLFAELDKLITTEGLFNASIRDQVISQLARLKPKFHLPEWYRFYPRQHVVPGGLPYDEEFVRVENFGKLSTGVPGQFATYASGFAMFNPKSGVFSMVGYSMGSVADVRAGPIVTIETKQEPADISLTANVLLDYQYQLSASSNPAFQPGASAISMISFKLDLLIDVEILDAAGALLFGTRGMKRIKYAELKPESTLPPYIAGTEEIVSGTSLQGGAISVPVTWDYDISAPANSRVRIGLSYAPFVTATGHRGSHDHKYLGIADGRASGQVTSVQAMVFT